MKKKKTMLAVAAAAALSIMLSSVPGVSADTTNKYTNTEGNATNWLTGNGIKVTTAGSTNTSSYGDDTVYKDKDGHPFETAVPGSNPYTMVKKILVIEDDSSIPAASFTITATAGAAVTPESTDTTHLPVKAGPDPAKIKWQAVDVASNDFTNATETAKTDDDYTITYVANNVKGDVKNITTSTTTTATPDNKVKISAGEDGNYYAEKEVKLDFSGCLFTEPGVYRYILTETTPSGAANTGITNDPTDTRTLDVYVQDASYYTRTGDVEPYTYTINPKLAITGFVLYKDTVTTAPLKEGSTESDEVTLEDGTTKVKPTVARAGEPEKAEKSVGFINKYETNKLKITKTVTGNQGSRDQYFKFTLKSNEADADKIPDTAVFYVSAVAADTSISKNLSGVNSATKYAYGDINTANTFTVPVTGMDTDKILGTFTGAQLKSTNGVVFYLQHDQYITVTGLPTGIGYTVTEAGEDYKVKYEAKSGANLDNVTDDTWNTSTSAYNTGEPIANGDGAVGTADGISAADTNMKGDAQVDFTNTKEGVIPTGVILSVAAPVIIGIIAAAGIIALFIRKRRKAD